MGLRSKWERVGVGKTSRSNYPGKCALELLER